VVSTGVATPESFGLDNPETTPLSIPTNPATPPLGTLRMARVLERVSASSPFAKLRHWAPFSQDRSPGSSAHSQSSLASASSASCSPSVAASIRGPRVTFQNPFVGLACKDAPHLVKVSGTDCFEDRPLILAFIGHLTDGHHLSRGQYIVASGENL